VEGSIRCPGGDQNALVKGILAEAEALQPIDGWEVAGGIGEGETKNSEVLRNKLSEILVV
jgi:hypothetical protein